MELKRRLSPAQWFIGLYVLAFVIYVVVGLQPASALIGTNAVSIPSVNIVADTEEVEIVDGKLPTPDYKVGKYAINHNKTFLFGHSSTVFYNLDNVKLGDTVSYNEKTYHIISIEKLIKSHISMTDLLQASNVDTLVMMTCAGELYDSGDASHRLIITAVSE